MSTHPIILFDGVCNLCTSSVQFVIRLDRDSRFRFAALQSAAGESLLRTHHLDPKTYTSVVLFLNGRVYQRSRAALEIARRLSGFWPLLYSFIIVPPIIRDWVYDWIAGNRYKWFGRKDECMIPTPELRSRFFGLAK